MQVGKADIVDRPNHLQVFGNLSINSPKVWPASNTPGTKPAHLWLQSWNTPVKFIQASIDACAQCESRIHETMLQPMRKLTLSRQRKCSVRARGTLDWTNSQKILKRSENAASTPHSRSVALDHFDLFLADVSNGPEDQWPWRSVTQALLLVKSSNCVPGLNEQLVRTRYG